MNDLIPDKEEVNYGKNLMTEISKESGTRNCCLRYFCLHSFSLQRGFVDFFHVEDPESAVRSTLMAVAGFAGLASGLAFLIR